MASQDEFLAKILEFMPKEVKLSYVESRDDFSDDLELLQSVIDDGNLDKVYDGLSECEFNESYSERIILEQVTERLLDFYELTDKDDLDALFDNREEFILDLCRQRDTSNVAKDLLENTNNISVRVEMLSNYDCINSHYFERGYSYIESYFGDMVDVLNLNPAKVKQILIENNVDTYGRFPNKSYRNGKEFVTYEDFYRELENSCSPANLLTFVGKLSGSDLYDFDGKKIVIPKGNDCGLFSSFCGGGSTIEMELQKEFVINLKKRTRNGRGFRLLIDKASGYSIESVYGPSSKFWGSNVAVVYLTQ